MKVTILLFASVAEAAGTRRIEMPIGESARVEDIRDALVRDYPAIERYVPNLLFALDEHYVDPSAVVTPGATLALIPPVSGGAPCFA